jgi:PTH1 family peptidyl-tRNA hydrolase
MEEEKSALMEQNEADEIYLIAGLGNPGREYRNNRHNSGFMILDRLAGKLDITFGRLESKALVAKGTYRGKRLILAKPQTYMNESGKAIGALMRFYKIAFSNLMVAYDDVDLPFGSLRLRPDGGAAGQKGMLSIQERLGTDAFPRLRFGVGRPPGRMEAAAYVLQDFSRLESEFLTQLLDRAAEAILVYVCEGLDRAMNAYNGPVEGNQG